MITWPSKGWQREKNKKYPSTSPRILYNNPVVRQKQRGLLVYHQSAISAQPSAVFTSVQTMQHDSSYKLIFANPEMMRDLFIGFVNEPWVADIDFSTLERFPNSYITDDLRRREDDIIWRVNIKGHTVYVYILLEFQASVDQFMAVRIMGYLALLYQDLIQSNNLAEGGLYPRFFPWCYTMDR